MHNLYDTTKNASYEKTNKTYSLCPKERVSSTWASAHTKVVRFQTAPPSFDRLIQGEVSQRVVWCATHQHSPPPFHLIRRKN